MKIGLLVFVAVLALPAQELKTIPVEMPDGTRLATDLHLPPQLPAPAVLVRTPYNKGALASLAAEGVQRGYAVVIQDTRGRFASDGRNLPFSGEQLNRHQDGADTLRWIARQPWSNGKIGTYGGSALGITQVLLGSTEPELLDAQHISVAPARLFEDFVFPGGIFKKHLVEFWIESQKFEPHALAAWKERSRPDPDWAAQAAEAGRAHAPAMHVGGYYDLFAQGTIDLFRAYQHQGGEGARGRQKLILGPWTHVLFIPWSGELKFDNAAEPPGKVHDHWRWFDHHLKGIDNGMDRHPAVTYYVMGDVSDPAAPGKEWKTAADWPPHPNRLSMYLAGSGELALRKPAAPGRKEYRHDPGNPAPTTGGLHFFKGVTAGSMDQRKLEQRPDVLIFTSSALETPLEIAGNPALELWLASSARETDLHVKLCDVYPDGRSINIAEAPLRIPFAAGGSGNPSGTPRKVELTLSPTAIVFHRGHKIRVQITSGSSPGFETHPLPATNTVHWGGDAASRILLPVAR